MKYFPLSPFEPRALFFLVPAWFVAFFATAVAQDLPRPSSSRARDAGGSFSRPYNLKIGPVAFTANAGVGLEYIDNVNLSSKETSGDLTIRTGVGVSAVWQVTRLNSLELQTSFGYTKYLSHPELDSQAVNISPDSALQFNLFVGDVKFIFREQFSLEQDPINLGAASNVAALGRFTNSIGVTALWDLNDVIWSAGYSHFNLITTGKAATTEGDLTNNLSVLDRASDQFTSAVFLKLDPTAGLGIEGTASYNTYPNNARADSTTYSLGPFLDLQLTRYTRVIVSGGYQLYSSQNGGSAANPPAIGGGGIPGIAGFGVQPPSSSAGRNDSDGSGYYFTLALTHRLNRFYSDRLSIAREFQLGVLADRTETTSASYSSSWQLSRRITLGTSISYEHVTQTSQFARAFNGNTLPDFDRLAISFGTGFQVTRKLNVGLGYSFVKRITDSGDLDYTQSRASVQFGYQF